MAQLLGSLNNTSQILGMILPAPSSTNQTLQPMIETKPYNPQIKLNLITQKLH